ncbi:MAG: hypothetical protein WCB99_14460 [Candidatus Cybelea sp.]
MKRADLFKGIAAALPLGAVALVPEPKEHFANPKSATRTDTGKTKWMIVHPGDPGELPSHHEYGQPCRSGCSSTGIPAPIYYQERMNR